MNLIIQLAEGLFRTSFLFAGEPGVGKSTLTLQITESLSNLNLRILYVCGEESPIQIKHRADRLIYNKKCVVFT